MKKIIALTIMVFISAIAVGRTTAYFTDTAVSSGNTFSSGTLTLTIVEDFSVNFANMAPGEKTDPEDVLFRNDGSLSFAIDNIWVNNLAIDETASEDSCNVTASIFGEKLMVYIDHENENILESSLKSIEGGEEITSPMILDENQEGSYAFQFKLSSDVDNDYQGCVLEEFEFEIQATQINN